MDLWTSTTLPPPLLEDGTHKDEAKEEETGLTFLSPGCTIEGESYMDGMQARSIDRGALKIREGKKGSDR